MHSVLVIGGGAAGYFAAIAAAEANPACKVTLLEASARPLAKVLVSGGGRCNVTHACFDSRELVRNYPRGARELLGPFSRFQPKDTIAWFESRGVRLKVEADGRMFPVTDSSHTIADCLRNAAEAAGVEVRLKSRLVALKQTAGFEAVIEGDKQSQTARFSRAIIATGSASIGHRIAASLGHTITTTVPSLFTFVVKDNRLEDLAGVSVAETEGTLVFQDGNKFRQQGALLVTHWGLSGPMVLRLSAWAARELAASGYRATLHVNWLPRHTGAELTEIIEECEAAHSKMKLRNQSPVDLPRRLWSRLVDAAGIGDRTWAELGRRGRERVRELLQDSRFEVEGKGVFKEEFVTCGGVMLSEVDMKSMESRLVKGLYFAGEVLDIDGITGGFNFQAAWTTGWLAGQGAAGGKNGDTDTAR